MTAKADHTYVVDVHGLQTEAFDICGENGSEALRSIIKSPDIFKLVYDVRRDSDALYHQFGIKTGGILDVQLFKLAPCLNLSTTQPHIAQDFISVSSGVDMTYEAKQRWLDIKRIGKNLWDPEQGGSWDRFTERNKCKEMIEYCLVDVVHLRNLYYKAVNRLSERWIETVKDATEDSIEDT
jgi:exonuclease 3'-5' domain-containing protein 1